MPCALWIGGSLSRPYDKEFEDAEGTILRVYVTVDEQDVNHRAHVRVISDALVKELVFDKGRALRFINTMLEALGTGTEIKIMVES